MAKTLERDLGLYATTTIGVGAMIGSGIFVLPGLAFEVLVAELSCTVVLVHADEPRRHTFLRHVIERVAF